MTESWEETIYKKWMDKLDNSLPGELKTLVKNTNNPAICNSNTMSRLKKDIVRSNEICKQIDSLIEDYKLSNKSPAAKKTLKTNFDVMFNNDDHVGFGDDSKYNNLSDTDISLAFSNVAEKISSLKVTPNPKKTSKDKKENKDKEDKDKEDKDKKEKNDKKKKKKKINATKSNTLFLNQLYETFGGGEVMIKKNKSGGITLEKGKVEIFKTLENPPVEDTDIQLSENLKKIAK